MRSSDSRSGNGASLTSIEAAQRELGLAFPPEYVAYLNLFGWLEHRHSRLFGLGEDIPAYLDLVCITLSERTEMYPPIPPHLLPLMNDGAGNHFCLDTSRMLEGKCPVVFWDHEHELGADQEPLERAKTFTAWLWEEVFRETEPSPPTSESNAFQLVLPYEDLPEADLPMTKTKSGDGDNLVLLGTVSSEGGPLLIADSKAARCWRGAEGDGSDYRAACQVGEEADPNVGGRLERHSETFVVWNMGGSGTVFVFRTAPDRIRIVRPWISEQEAKAEIFALMEQPAAQPRNVVQIEITSGVLAILWTPESGECIAPPLPDDYGPPSGETSIDGTVLLIRVSTGSYTLFQDTVQLPHNSEALRCHIEPILSS